VPKAAGTLGAPAKRSTSWPPKKVPGPLGGVSSPFNLFGIAFVRHFNAAFCSGGHTPIKLVTRFLVDAMIATWIGLIRKKIKWVLFVGVYYDSLDGWALWTNAGLDWFICMAQ